MFNDSRHAAVEESRVLPPMSAGGKGPSTYGLFRRNRQPIHSGLTKNVGAERYLRSFREARHV